MDFDSQYWGGRVRKISASYWIDNLLYLLSSWEVRLSGQWWQKDTTQGGPPFSICPHQVQMKKHTCVQNKQHTHLPMCRHIYTDTYDTGKSPPVFEKANSKYINIC